MYLRKKLLFGQCFLHWVQLPYELGVTNKNPKRVHFGFLLKNVKNYAKKNMCSFETE